MCSLCKTYSFVYSKKRRCFTNALCSYSTAVLIAEIVRTQLVLEFRKQIIVIFRFIKETAE